MFCRKRTHALKKQFKKKTKNYTCTCTKRLASEVFSNNNKKQTRSASEVFCNTEKNKVSIRGVLQHRKKQGQHWRCSATQRKQGQHQRHYATYKTRSTSEVFSSTGKQGHHQECSATVTKQSQHQRWSATQNTARGVMQQRQHKVDIRGVLQHRQHKVNIRGVLQHRQDTRLFTPSF